MRQRTLCRLIICLLFVSTSEVKVRFCISKTNLSTQQFSYRPFQGDSPVAALLSLNVSDSIFGFSLSLFVTHPYFCFWCLRKAVLHDCDNSWVSPLIYFKTVSITASKWTTEKGVNELTCCDLNSYYSPGLRCS